VALLLGVKSCACRVIKPKNMAQKALDLLIFIF